MSDGKKSNIRPFETRNLDLATFLVFEGEEIQSYENRNNVVYMIFKDRVGACRDLEIVFLHSDFKKYRDLHRMLLGRIHDCLKD